MIGPVRTSVTRIPANDQEPAIRFGPTESGANTALLYQRFGTTTRCPAGEQIIAIVSTGALNTPDRVKAAGSRSTDDSFELALEILRFDGPMAANDPWVGLVRIELGTLDPGPYRLTIHETTARFTDLHHPDTSTDRTTTVRSVDFVCEGAI